MTMKALIRFISVLVVACMSAVACNDNVSKLIEPGKAGADVTIGSVTIASPDQVVVKSSDEESEAVPVYEDPETGTCISVSTRVVPMSSDLPQTRVQETTTSNLSSFIVDAYLGDDIETCRWASDADKANRNFIPKATASKGGDGKWHFGGSGFQWRSCVDHHFWAYNGSPLGFQVDGSFDKATFSYENSGTEDMVMANYQEYWVDENNESEHPLVSLPFKHALSQVTLDHSAIVRKQFNVVGGEEIAPSTRLTVSNVQLLNCLSGSCTATGGDFAWVPSTTDYAVMDCTGSDNSAFVIPQKPNNSVAVLSIYDSYRDVTTPIFVELPSISTTTWQPGTKYQYRFLGTICAPYYSNLGHLDPGFFGKNFQSFAVMKNLLSKYVSEVKVTWKGLPVCKSNDTPIAVVYVPSGVTPSSDIFPMASIGDTDAWSGDGNVGFVASASHSSITNVKKGRIVSGSTSSPTTCECEAIFTIPDNVDPPITFYLLYDGDNNGNASWILNNFDIEVTKFKYPVQTLP